MVDLDSTATTTPTVAAPDVPVPRSGRRDRSMRKFAVPGVAVVVAGAIVAVVLVFVTHSSSKPITPAVAADRFVQAGLQAQAAGRTNLAIADFEAATVKDPTNKFAYYDLGVIYQERLNQPSVAAAAYRKAVLADPTYKPALFNLAILETTSDPQGAINLYNQLLQMNPNDANVLFNLGLLLIAQNQAPAGHADLKKAIQINAALASRVPAGITP